MQGYSFKIGRPLSVWRATPSSASGSRSGLMHGTLSLHTPCIGTSNRVEWLTKQKIKRCILDNVHLDVER